MSKQFAMTAILGTIVAALVLAACGSSSPSDPAASERESEQQAETKFADFAKCLREHGIQAEAISHPGGGHGLKIGPAPGAAGSGKAEQGPEAMEAAQKACARYQPAPQKANLSPQQKVEQEEAVQKFARCMREHGIKVETSGNGGGAIRIRIRAHPGSGPNPESPAFQRAQNTCQKLLPKFGGAKGGPGPGG